MAKILNDEQIAQKKAELIQIAMEILEAEGLQALTLRRLAMDAGISRSTPYLYFKDKSELIKGICIEIFQYLIRQIREAMSESDDNREKIMAMGRCYLKFGVERPNLYHLIFMPESPEDKECPEVSVVVEEYIALSQVPMQEAYDEGLLKYPPERLNPVLWACSHGLLSLRWAGHLSEEALYEQVKNDMEQILGMGFIDKEKYTELYGNE
ncbi:MAG: TetR/AcrR family transcriptional regulator [Sneathiella sp.]|nr:TetR/AcrR family transcriptional regulator [Sneathiella sp.]